MGRTIQTSVKSSAGANHEKVVDLVSSDDEESTSIDKMEVETPTQSSKPDLTSSKSAVNHIFTASTTPFTETPAPISVVSTAKVIHYTFPEKYTINEWVDISSGNIWCPGYIKEVFVDAIREPAFGEKKSNRPVSGTSFSSYFFHYIVTLSCRFTSFVIIRSESGL